MGILQYFQTSLSFHLSFRPMFCLFLSGCFRLVLLYQKKYHLSKKKCKKDSCHSEFFVVSSMVFAAPVVCVCVCGVGSHVRVGLALCPFKFDNHLSMNLTCDCFFLLCLGLWSASCGIYGQIFFILLV